MSRAALGITLLLSAALTSCVSTRATMLSGSKRAAIAPSSVKIYRSVDQIPGKYEEVALLISSGDYSVTSETALYEGMRKKAAEMGANGVLLQTLEEPTTGQKVSNALLLTPANRRGKAIAIYVFESEAVP